MAAVAYQKVPPGDTDNGTHVMVAGILFQLLSILVFVALFILVIVRALKSKAQALKQRRVQLVIAATVFSVALVVARSVYRTIELLQGWTGYLITSEKYFIALDGVMMLSAVGVFNFVRPGWANATTDRDSNQQAVEENELEDNQGEEDRGEENQPEENQMEMSDESDK